jgi:hypothetical protein
MSSSSADLRQELSYLRDNLIEAIRDHRPGAVEDGLEIYTELISEFVELLSAVGVSYDRERAMQELTSIKGGWDEVDWIRRDLKDLTDAAFDTADFRMIDEVFGFVYGLARLALGKNDYYIYYHF